MKLILSALLAGAVSATTPALAQTPDQTPDQTRAQAPATADAYQGRTVRDAKGGVLGQIDKVVLGASGRPQQVLVRPVGRPAAGVRALAVSGLSVDGDGFTTPLTKAEFEAMPTVELDRN